MLISTDTFIATFSLIVGVVTALLVACSAIYFIRRVRIERPAIGKFNGRDIAILFVLLSTIPLFYTILPRWLLTAFLALTFVASLSIGFRPVLSPAALWLGIGFLIGLNIWLGDNMLGSVAGWQLFWAENDVIVLLGAVSVANLYVQGGMSLRHVAWFALLLAAYDVVFTAMFPVTIQLVEKFLGYPLDPSMGMRWSFDNAAVGIGDLLVYALFAVAAFKAYGRAAARVAIIVTVIFGSAVPALVPLVIDYVDARTDTLVPAQAWFGPAAFLTYRLLRRKYGRERTTQEFLASADVKNPVVIVAPAGRPQPAPASVDRQHASEPVEATT